mgnify:CR=1 FL=1
MTAADPYRAFLEAKIPAAADEGIAITPGDVSPVLKPHQRDIVLWAVRGGRRAIFAAFGLGKTLIQIETVRLVLARVGGRGLIVMPLGVRQEFRRDAAMLGLTLSFVRRSEEVTDPAGIYITNYESIRDGKIDPALFSVVSLDEAAVLRGFGGTKTFRELMRSLEPIPYRFVATATPSPNAYIELLAYAAFLGVMDVGQAKTRWFKRNSEKADELTLHEHKEAEFWLWVASWGLFVQRPSDLGHDDTGYDLPPLNVLWHEVPSDHRAAGAERDGQQRMFANAAIGVSDSAREKRRSLDARVARLVEILRDRDEDQAVIWCDLNDEQRAIEAALEGAGITHSSLYGNQDIEERETLVEAWRQKRTQAFLSKPVMYGAGINLQQCHTMVFAGIGFKAKDIIQAVHRIHRFQQARPCAVHLVYSEAERDIRRNLEGKWQRHNDLVARMSGIIREHGLAEAARIGALKRTIGVERAEAKGERWTLVNNDTVDETRGMPADSVGLIVTSIPFSTQYEYTPSYNDFGHSESNEAFWRQMDFLTPELLRVLQPGRVMCVHVKDRIVPGGMTGLGFQCVYAMHADAIAHYQRHGFAFLGMRTIATDVVRENNQTYRLGWSEQCKDGSRMGPGMSEYLLTFRKPPTDSSNGYADLPVVKPKPLCDDHGEPRPFDPKTNWRKPVPGTGYSRARWQMDAHGFWRSSGDRLLTTAELRDLPHDQVYKLWRDRSLSTIYDHEGHVAVAEQMDALERLPSTFMLLPPHAPAGSDTWSDVARMRTLNGAQSAAGREMHLCPLQFDIVERAIRVFSMPGEVVFDPFSGLGTVAYCAVRMGRRGLGVELNPAYHRDAVGYCQAAEREMAVPTLFQLLAIEDREAA